MGNEKLFATLATLHMTLALALFANSTLAVAQKETLPPSPNTPAKYKVIHDFNGPDGAGANGNALTVDKSGNLYGETSEGGDYAGCFYGCGTAFKLTRTPAGGWARSILHRFTPGPDGYYPLGGSLALDGSGNLYGTAALGGQYDVGVVFELSPTVTGSWSYTALYSFGGGGDGEAPGGNLVFDATGNLYGTTGSGGAYGYGAVFEIWKVANGDWRETVLYSFTGGPDGSNPGGLAIDLAGNLYGATYQGGNLAGCPAGDGSCGVVFELSRDLSGAWTETVIHAFNKTDGAFPWGSLTLDAGGSIYGTTEIGGSGCFGDGCGVVYEISPNPLDGWNESVLHAFGPGINGFGGAQPCPGIAIDATGNLFGATTFGGRAFGTVFRLSPTTRGWKESVLHAFYDGTDGGGPYSGVTIDATGRLFGMTSIGGIASDCITTGPGCGVVYEIEH